jgi:D-glycero-D-manno-heptose 1,7-bisphosphate phosphatase
MHENYLEEFGVRYGSLSADSYFLVWENTRRTPSPTCIMVADRDNTLINDDGYVHEVADLRVFQQAINALKLVNSVGGAIVIATNQGGIGLGKYSIQEYAKFNLQMIQLFEREGIRIDFVLACPHHPFAETFSNRHCQCRKPKTDMLKFVQGVYAKSFTKVAVFGDAVSDLEFAKNFELTSYHINKPSDLATSVSDWLESINLLMR